MTVFPRRARAALGGLVVVLGLAPAAPAQAPDGGCRVVVDHADGTPGEFPAGWEPRDDAARATYRIAVEDGLRFVRATAEGTGSQMGREFPWNADSHPILSWEWRPRVFPPGSHELTKATNDSALAVYAVFGRTQATARAVKYVWSRVAPVGTTVPTGSARVIVLRSGPPADGSWITETVDVRRDYQRLYGEAPGRARGVAILTDADQTKSRAVGDYGAFRICAAPSR